MIQIFLHIGENIYLILFRVSLKMFSSKYWGAYTDRSKSDFCFLFYIKIYISLLKFLKHFLHLPSRFLCLRNTIAFDWKKNPEEKSEDTMKHNIKRSNQFSFKLLGFSEKMVHLLCCKETREIFRPYNKGRKPGTFTCLKGSLVPSWFQRVLYKISWKLFKF